jgi:hypothetical protein
MFNGDPAAWSCHINKETAKKLFTSVKSIYLRYEAFTAAEVKKVLSVYQRVNLLKSDRHFIDHFCLHHGDRNFRHILTSCHD